MPSSARVTRQAAVGRFRDTRLARRDSDLAERQKTLLAVAEQVTRIVEGTQRTLSETACDRRTWGETLRSDLARSHVSLSETMATALAESSRLRALVAEKDRGDRAAFVEKLRAEVVRIVSEDFLQGTPKPQKAASMGGFLHERRALQGASPTSQLSSVSKNAVSCSMKG